MNRPGPDAPQRWREELEASAIGYQLVLSLVLCAGLGWAIDRRWETSPWGLLGGLMLGIVAALGTAVRLYRRELDAGRNGEAPPRAPRKR